MTPWWIRHLVRVAGFLDADRLAALTDTEVDELLDAAKRVSMLTGLEKDRRKTEARRARSREQRRRSA